MQRRYEEYQRQLRLRRIEEAKGKYKAIISNSGMSSGEYDAIITKAATTEVDTGSVQKGMDIVNTELLPKVIQDVEASNRASGEGGSNPLKDAVDMGVNYATNEATKALTESITSGTTSAISSGVEGVADGVTSGTASAVDSGVENASSGGLSANAAIAYQAILGVIGGVPLSDSVSYSPSGSKGTYVCIPASSEALHPAANDSVTYTCTGVPFSGNTVIIPPVQQITINPSEGGNISQSIQGTTLTYHEHWVEWNSCGASISANAYDGGNTMSDAIYGGFSNYDEWRKQIEALGAVGEEYLRNMDNGFSSEMGLDGYNSSGYSDSTFGDAIYNSSGDGDIYSDSGVYPTDANGYTNDILNDMFGDGDGSYNSGGADWASSNSDGNLNGTDLDEYFDSGNKRRSISE